MLIKYQLNNNFIGSINSGTRAKFITMPLNMDFTPTDYTEDINDIVVSEREKAIYSKNSVNRIFDAETIRYKYESPAANNNRGLLLSFRLWNSTADTYTNGFSYKNADFTDDDIKYNRNAFKKSFFRLNFYDSNTGETSSIIFTEDISLYGSKEPKFYFNDLYWLRNDEYFLSNNSNRIIYMDATFFNAKNGLVQKFINIPPIPVNNLPIKIQDYSNPNNRSWRTSAIEIINPKNANGKFTFRPLVPFGSNEPDKITLSQFVMK
jgi:hypothetical protein